VAGTPPSGPAPKDALSGSGSSPGLARQLLKAGSAAAPQGWLGGSSSRLARRLCGSCWLYFLVIFANICQYIAVQNIYLMPGRAGGSRGEYTVPKRGTADCDVIGGAFWASRGSYYWRKGPTVTLVIYFVETSLLINHTIYY
jgi:hypothetical protein